jgi:hypothetical protein
MLLTTLCRLTTKVRRRPALIRSFVKAAHLPPLSYDPDVYYLCTNQ